MGEVRNAYVMLGGQPEVKRQREDLGVSGKIILEWTLGKLDVENMGWIHLVQYGDQWRALVNTVMNLRVP